ncbi:MAG TPA: exodeoxyribonuclease VII large subunit [Patescibacteria group bacterium]|nr:exodeoxyribonuclease VII large subunit [Patescibacteria group bacterium]
MTGAPSNVLRVGQLTARIGERLQATDEFKDLWVEGEIVETSRSSAGHVYFTLKDNTAQLQCVLFATQAMNVPLTPRQGLRVIAHGYIEVYLRAGSYNLRCDDVRPAGAGEAFLRLEALRKRLDAEGLFKQERKRTLPTRPRRVGVITSPTGAAWHDVQTVCLRRDPRVELIFAAAQVQGGGAVESMIAAFDGLAQLRDLDVIILARGGGASEDLSPFNDEALVRAVARAARPVCSGVGHESDVTLVDLAADVRAPTPSVAAELVVPDAGADVASLARLRRRVEGRIREIAVDRRRRATNAKRLLERRAPAARIAERRLQLDESRRAIDRAMARAVPLRRQRTVSARRRLEALSPLAVLGRGYAIVEGPDGRIRAEVTALRAGEQGTLRMRDGRAGVRIESVEVTDGRA